MIEELFLVLLPEGSVLEFAQSMQQKISEYYDIYLEDSYPEIHMTIDKINKDADEKKAIEVIESTLKNCEPVLIEIEEMDCFINYRNNFLVLNVVPTESLVQLAGRVHRELDKRDFSVIDDYEENWQFHITLISNYFAKNPLEEKVFQDLCRFHTGINFPHSSRAHHLELWRFSMDPQKKCITDFSIGQ